MRTRITLCAAAVVAAASLAGETAVARTRQGRQRTRMLQLARPEPSPDADAAGTARIRGDRRRVQTTLQLRHLDPRAEYQIRDGASGASVGTVRTDRAGRGRFKLTRGAARAASADGVDGAIAQVEIVDPLTGQSVLTGDVSAAAAVLFPSWNYAEMKDADGNDVEIWCTSDPAPWYGDQFTFSITPTFDPTDPGSAYHSEYFSQYFNAHGALEPKDPGFHVNFQNWGIGRDTSVGDALPLGVRTVKLLGGRAFEVRRGDGTVTLSGNFPEFELDKEPVYGSCEEDEGSDVGCYGEYYSTLARISEAADIPDERLTGPTERSWEVPLPDPATPGYRLFIADAGGRLRYALNLVPRYRNWYWQQEYDSGGEIHAYIYDADESEAAWRATHE